jgi:molybdate transport system substrate-binding protein
MSLKRCHLALTLVLLCLSFGCSSGRTPAPTPAGKPTLTVFAASSLTDAFKEIGALFEASSGSTVVFNVGASSQLRTQLEQGASADVFASADNVQMDRARQAGVIAGREQIFATNRLMVITPVTNPAAITGPEDLAKGGIKIVSAQLDVPIGAYTQSMFEAMSLDPRLSSDFEERANANIVSREPNVRQIVAKIQLGEGDAAVVYKSDITPQAAPDLATFEIPDAFNTPVQYPIARVTDGPAGEEAAHFIAFVLSPEGQAVLKRWNFLTVTPTSSESSPAQ